MAEFTGLSVLYVFNNIKDSLSKSFAVWSLDAVTNMVPSLLHCMSFICDLWPLTLDIFFPVCKCYKQYIKLSSDISMITITVTIKTLALTSQSLISPSSCPVIIVSSRAPHNIADILGPLTEILEIASSCDNVESTFRTSIINISHWWPKALSVENTARFDE